MLACRGLKLFLKAGFQSQTSDEEYFVRKLPIHDSGSIRKGTIIRGRKCQDVSARSKLKNEEDVGDVHIGKRSGRIVNAKKTDENPVVGHAWNHHERIEGRDCGMLQKKDLMESRRIGKQKQSWLRSGKNLN